MKQICNEIYQITVQVSRNMFQQLLKTMLAQVYMEKCVKNKKLITPQNNCFKYVLIQVSVESSTYYCIDVQ